ncbi:MAG: phenylalanine--tRNA ligase subunit beta, partial [Thermodesulfovibrionales bacterium]|nr:phenylalanine--tRNA ligase subunit beta [Thermodesulfovibrionales bacterium]
PAFRLDVKTDADVIEEIARIYGYGKIPASAPRAVISSEGISRRSRLISRVKEAVRMAGYTEAVNYSFMNSRHLDTLGLPEDDRRRKAVAIKNPLRKEDSLLRTTLVPSLMETLKYNLFSGIKDIRVFEVSRVFEDIGELLPFESLRLGGIFYREKTPELWKEQAGDFYLVKGALESVFEELRLKGCSFSASTETFLHPGKSADIYLSGQRAGFIGALSPLVTEGLDIKPKADIMVFELDMDRLLLSVPASPSFEPIPRFPCVERDIAIVVDEGMKADEIIGLIKAYPSVFIEDASVFDYYKGANIPEGKKSLAFSVRYRSKDRTLTDEEVETVHNGLLSHLTEKAGGEIRK